MQKNLLNEKSAERRPAGRAQPVDAEHGAPRRSVASSIALAGSLIAVAVVGSLFSFPVFGSQCAPVQHMVNLVAAVFLGPVWGVGIALCASLLRNLMGLGTLMAFPGSMIGALCCGLMWKATRRTLPTCLAEALGTGILGGLVAFPVAKWLMGLHPAAVTIYIVPFLISTGVGSFVALLLLTIVLHTPQGRHFREEGAR